MNKPLIPRIVKLIGQWGLVLLLLAITVLTLWRTGDNQIAQDSWHVLLHGRDIAQNGLPQSDRFATWSAGEKWYNQQWLAHVITYQIYQVLDWPVVVTLHWIMILSALSLLMFNARAHPSRVFFIAVLCLPIVLQFSVFRAQSFIWPLFVILLLAIRKSFYDETLKPLLWFLPVLVIWANLHGSIIMGLGIWLLAYIAVNIKKKAYPLLLLSPLVFLIPFATPYGFKLLDYYHTTLFNSQFSLFIMEWKPLQITYGGAYFFLIGFSIFLAGLTFQKAPRFRADMIFLIILLIPALYSARYMLFGALAAMLILPQVLEELWPATSWRDKTDQLLRPIGLLCAMFIIGILCYSPFISKDVYYEKMPPEKALEVLEEYVPMPERIMLSERHGDWLLYHQPERRIVYTARLELLHPSDYKTIRCLYQNGLNCTDPKIRKINVFLLENTDETKDVRQTFDVNDDFVNIYQDDLIVIYMRKGKVDFKENPTLPSQLL